VLVMLCGITGRSTTLLMYTYHFRSPPPRPILLEHISLQIYNMQLVSDSSCQVSHAFTLFVFRRTFDWPFRLLMSVSVFEGIQSIVSALKARSHSWVLLTFSTLSYFSLPVPSIASFLSSPLSTTFGFPRRTK
jgi:hypothetical protein